MADFKEISQEVHEVRDEGWTHVLSCPLELKETF